MQLITVPAVVKYEPQQAKIIAELDWDFARYYLSLIPKYYGVLLPKYRSHISVVRKESIPLPARAVSVHGKRVQIQYSPAVQTDSANKYWWLDAWSADLCAVRRLVGLGDYRRLGPGIADRFHITVGNTKRQT